MQINSHTGWDQLKHVWLGDVYPKEFYSEYNPDVAEAFIEITETTKNDLKNIETILVEHGVKVTRPSFNSVNRGQHCDTSGYLVKPPIMPRDRGLVLGNTLYHQLDESYKDPWEYALRELEGEIIVTRPGEDNNCLCGPSVVRVGRDIFVDAESHEHVMPQVSIEFLKWAQDYRVHMIRTGGHSDGVFCPVAPGVIVTTHWKQDYKESFPNWQVFHMPEETPARNDHFGEWWVNSNVNGNGKFAEHIQKHAQNWVGNYKESQFSVNMLVLNNNTVLSISTNPRLLEFLDKLGINVLQCNFTHKGFWDGGMHCLTLDIERDGGKSNYFPQRANHNYLDWLK